MSDASLSTPVSRASRASRGASAVRLASLLDGRSVVRRVQTTAWRVVEAQHIVSTRKLVDSDEEHNVLEQLIEHRKPPIPSDPEFRGMHYLLTTPFRYPPLRHGSRFGTRNERGIWYGSDARHTAFAEAAYYRLLFLEGTTAAIPRLTLDLSVFSVPIRTRVGVDLTAPPFDVHRAVLAHPSAYAATQELGAAMRAAGIEAFVYRSARDRDAGRNLGAFSPRAFAVKTPKRIETWFCMVTPSAVEFTRKDFFARAPSHRFERGDFEVGGKLPRPAA